MQIYHFHPVTLEFVGTGFADESPLEPGVYLVPANATQATPPPPVAGTVRKFVDGAWVVEQAAGVPLDPEYVPSLAEIAAAKLDRINDAKNVALDGGFLHDGVTFDSDAKARLAYLELAFKLGQQPEYSTAWKASTGSWVTMDAALFSALQPAYEAHIQSCFGWQAAREMEVAAALALVDPETGDDAAARAALAAVSEVVA